MDPPKINYVDNNSILVVNPVGRMRQLFVPFRVQVIAETSILLLNSWVLVEQIKAHDEHIILYRVLNLWWPYNVFKLSVIF